jgi:hypothetical protein
MSKLLFCSSRDTGTRDVIPLKKKKEGRKMEGIQKWKKKKILFSRYEYQKQFGLLSNVCAFY